MTNKPKLWDEKRYHSLSSYLKNEYHEKVYKLSLNANLGCPNRDGTVGTGGCIFCSSGGSGDFAASSSLSISEQLKASKAQISGKTDAHKFIAYFQAYTNTYAPAEKLRELYLQAASDPEVVALSIATRPDCLGSDVLALLSEINRIKPVWVELGLQTIHDTTRTFLNSGFTYQTFYNAIDKLDRLHIPVIVHLILGLPHETHDMMLESVRTISHLPIWGIKLQLLHVLEHTELAAYYRKTQFPVFTLDAYCDMVVDCLELLPEHMVIHRITGDGPKDLLIAPLWSTNKKKVLNQIQHRLKERNTWQGRLYTPVI